MKFRILFSVLFFLMFYAYNATAQEITIDISKLKFSSEETIRISYRLEKQVDSLKLENKNFKVLENPSTMTNPSFTKITFVLKPLRAGRIKLPRMIMYSKKEVIKSNEMFVEITEQELREQDKRLLTYNVGFTFNISLPTDFERTSGINGSSLIEYKSEKNDTEGYVIVDNKEEKNIPYTFSAVDYRDEIMKDFMINEENRKIFKSEFLKKGEINFIKTEMTIFDKKEKKTFRYFIGIAETNKAFYRVISWTTESDKINVKSDLENILYSIKD